MSFLSATLLLGTLAAGVPIVLHLLARQPPRRVVFPSVRFLQRHLTTQSSRLKVRRWWLLALRILALIALAIVLARPHIGASMSSQWTTAGLILLAGVGLLVMASLALTRGLSRKFCWSLLVAALVTMSMAGLAAIRSLASGTAPQLQLEQPLAVAIVIDNSPSSAWSLDDQVAGQIDEAWDDADSVSGTVLAVAIARTDKLIGRLPAGSRVAIVDRSTAPIGFSLDDAAARARLARLIPITDPAPIADRISAAVELVRTSDLANRQVVVVSDLSAATWRESMPASASRSPLAAPKHEGVPISVLDIHQEQRAGLSSNTWLSLPVVADVAPSPGVAIAIRFEVGVWSAADADSATTGGPPRDVPRTATVQLSLYERDPALPVVRDGNVVYPPLRTVDRASIELAGGNAARAASTEMPNTPLTEVLLTLPPLERGTYHGVVELVGGDRFAMDNRRYVTIDLPTPPNVLIVGDDQDEVDITALALTAPHPPDDAAAGYRIETAAYVDLAAVDWKRFEMVILIDPPLSIGKTPQTNKPARDRPTLSSALLREVAGVATRGGGVLVSLGPGTQTGEAVLASDTTLEDEETQALLPRIVRSWRIPSPGTFWRIDDRSHPVFESMMRPTSMPNWGDFRVTRYWQVAESTAGAGDDRASDQWNVLARYVSADDENADHPAVLTRTLGSGRVAVVTTPLPAIGPATRTWNDLFGAADAWPAFMTLRNLAAYLSGIDRRGMTILTGQTAIISIDPGAEDGDPGSQPKLQLYPPGELTDRAITYTPPNVVIEEVNLPGTYFLRAPDIWSGISANLPMRWSSGERLDSDLLANWFGEQGWSIADQVDSLTLSAGSGGSAAVSLHAPLTLLTLIVFLAEQILSNRFYGATRNPGAG